MSPGIPTRLLASQSDDRLLVLVRQGHERAFEALVHRYRKPLLSYCRRLPLPDARAEDIIQLALLKTWIAVREGAEVRDVKAWLYRVVHNTAVNAVRDSAHDGEPLADPGQRIGAAETDVDRRLAVREALTEVAALPPLQREVIVRTAVAGHSHEQVASDLGITNGAVRGLLYRARVTLRTAVTALTPTPLLGWLAGRADQGGLAPERLTELAGGGGTVGIGGLLLKGGVVALTAGTVITGAAVVHIEGSSHHRSHHRLIARAPTGAAAGATETGPLVASTQPGGERGGRSLGLRSTRPAARRAPGRGGTKAHAPGGARSFPVGGGRGAPRSVARPHRGGGGGAPGSGKTVQSTGTPGTAGQGSSPSGSGQGGESGQSGAGQSGAGQSGASGQGGASPGQAEPVGSAAGNGSGSGAGGSGSSGQGPTEGGGAPSGGQPGGSSGSGSSGSSSPEGSGGQGSSPSGSESSSGSGGGSGSLVGTVVHEVGSILEHVLH